MEFSTSGSRRGGGGGVMLREVCPEIGNVNFNGGL